MKIKGATVKLYYFLLLWQVGYKLVIDFTISQNFFLC